MKRKAIFIGNTNGLQGVKTDLKRTHNFLSSSYGGGWYSNEIIQLTNPRKDHLLMTLETIKKESNDYVIVLFSGHGAQERQIILELNDKGEIIPESNLLNLASRQLSIFDCCRVVPEMVYKSFSQDSISASINESLSVRRKYEARIMSAIPQQARLYSCSIGESSYDTPQGGMYLGSLLSAARNIGSDLTFKTVGSAHEEAIIATLESSKRQQSPEAILPKCLSTQQLIIAMRP